VHNDVKVGDRVLWISSTSWMIWNAHVLCLAVGATLVLYEGAPSGSGEVADWSHLWRLAQRVGVTMFGAGAAFFHTCMKSGIEPRRIASLDALRSVASTGSPLSADGYRWLYRAVNSDLWVNSVSGGTDICGAFVGGVPTLPVYVGEMQCRVLGAAVQAYSDAGGPVLDEVGELVCERPLPSMPLYFWGDHDKRRYLESYFETFASSNGERIWRHGDWLKLIPREGAVGAIIYGRSDATINRHGVRMGTAEFYRVVEGFDEVLDSLVVDLEYLGRPSYMALFVVLREGALLTPELDQRLKDSIRDALSPRHVPNEILSVPGVPRTLTGKKLEMPIKKLLLGHVLEGVIARDAIANPAALDWFIDFAQQRTKA
jgi:acetoacetyl-CoA synthetase